MSFIYEHFSVPHGQVRTGSVCMRPDPVLRSRRKVFNSSLYKLRENCYNKSKFVKGGSTRERTPENGPDGGCGHTPAGDAPLRPEGGLRPLLRPGQGAGGGRMGQCAGGVPHKKRQADHPGECLYLFQPDLRGAGGVSAAGGGLEGHDLPVHCGGQRRHRHRPAAEEQADHRKAVPALCRQGPGGAGRQAPEPAGGPAGAGRCGGAHRRQPDPGGRAGAHRPGPGE